MWTGVDNVPLTRSGAVEAELHASDVHLRGRVARPAAAKSNLAHCYQNMSPVYV